MKYPILFLISLFINSFAIFGQSIITFQVDGLPEDGQQKVGIRGSTPPLDWGSSIPLTRAGDTYTATLEFPTAAAPLEFKFVRYNKDTDPTWENTQNRILALFPDSNYISKNQWNKEQIVDLSTLEPLTPKELLADFEIIKTMVLEIHPGTYRYNSKQQIQAALDELETKFRQPLTHGEAYLAISKLTAQIKCDHTKAGFNNQNRTINSIIHYQKDKIPFTFKWVDEQMIVLQNASQSELLTRGTAVLSINGIPAQEIQQKMMQYVGADGATDNNRRYKTEVNAYDFRYNAFDIFFPLLYPLSSDSLTLEIQAYGTEKTQQLQVTTLTREERSALLVQRYPAFPETRDDLWNFEILEDNIGLLTINSFGLNGWKAMTIDYKQFLADAFEQLRGKDVKHLIIDIRENNGGADEMAEELFTYLTPAPGQFEREGRTRYLRFPESLKPYVKTWGDNPWFYNPEPQNTSPINGYYIFPEGPAKKAQGPRKKVFPGKVYLLTSAANTSLAFYTAYKFKLQNIGTSIGQETGGNLNDINGGQILFLQLPNSTIEIDFPVMGGFALSPQPDMGVKPDIETVYTLADIINKRDVEMETVLRTIH